MRSTTRLLVLIMLAFVVGGSSILPGVDQASAQQDSRYFSETGFRIDNDRIWDYFSKRNGKRNFGLPTSRTFQFMGAPTQFFQRHVLQVQGNSVKTLNLLEEGLLPYTTISGSTFPSVDESVVSAAPKAGSATYTEDVATYLDKYAPNTWEGEPVKFGETFSNSVTLADAFPDGGGSAGLLMLLNLEIWGLPTSKPARDPGNNNFVFLRFQRGVMHYDGSCKCTQALLLADALKAVITNQNLPADLGAQAADSPLFGQYDPEIHNGPLHAGLPGGIELANAFRPSLDNAEAGTPPALAQGSSAPSKPTSQSQAEGKPESKPESQPSPKPSQPAGPPKGDPKQYLAKESEAGKGANEESKESKTGSDNQKVWASNRIERSRSWANYNSGPVAIASKAIIAHDVESAKKIYDEEVKLNERMPEAKDKVGQKFEFNMEGDQDVGEQAKGLSACLDSQCEVENDDDNLIHRRMVFQVGHFVGVVYTFGMSVPEGNTQAYARLFAQSMVQRMRSAL